MWQDVRHSLRVIRRYPFSSAAIVVVLALGIGGNTSMFAGFHAWVTRPLDFRDPERLVAPYSMRPLLGEREHAVSAADASDWRRECRRLDLALFQRALFDLADEDDPERIQGARVEASLFPLLGVEPVLGRGFAAEEDLPGRPDALALISDSLWRRRFGADPAVVGRDLELAGRRHRVVGIMKPGFAFPEWAEVWVPLGLDPDAEARDHRVYDLVGRLAYGAGRGEAAEELRAVAARLAALHPETNRGWSAELLPLREKWLPPVVRTALVASLGASFLALLVICANVAGLLLAQAGARSREMALRAALGAGRARLVRQTVTECTVLAAAGGVLGVPVAILLNRWTLSLAPTRPPYLFAMTIDGWAVLFAGAVTLAAGVACGLAPVVRNASAELWRTLAGGARAGGAPRAQRLGSLLVAAELALSTALGIGAMLLAKSFLEQRLARRGYRVDDVVALRLRPGAGGEGDAAAAARAAFVEAAVERAAALPEVAAVGATSRLPAGQGFTEARLEVEGVAAEAGEEPVVAAQWVTTGYFDALAIPRLDGRDFTTGESRDGAPVAMVSATLAQRLWPGESPLGRRLRPLRPEDGPWLSVVGTVGDIEPVESMVASATPERLHLYRPWSARPAPEVTLVVHARAPAERAVAAVRAAVRRLDPGAVIDETLTMADALDRDHWVSRLFSQLLGLYAGIAVAIALVGSYGLTADAAARRTHELAVRMALGARRRQVLALVMRRGVLLAAAGIGVGIVLALALTRFGSAMIPGVSARDPWVFAGISALVAAVTVAAVWLPARSATRVEPAAALRAE